MDIKADFGAVGDGATDDTAAFQSALSQLAAIAPWATSGRATNRPSLHVPAGTYVVTASLAIGFSGFSLRGDGKRNSCIAWAGGDAPVFDIGTFSTAPTDLFAGPNDATFDGVRIHNATSRASGTRQGQAIRMGGGGNLRLSDFAAFGFAYGVNCAYGCDFNRYRDCLIEVCDVGMYHGPGSQQFHGDSVDFFACREGFVLDRAGQGHFTMPTFINCELAGIVIEATGSTSTRQLTSFPASGTSYQSNLVFDSPWFEGNAGGMGDQYVTTYFVECRSDQSECYRDITFRNPKIVAGNTQAKTTTAYFANTGASLAQRVRHQGLVFSGAIGSILRNPGGDMIEGYRVENGYTAPPKTNKPTYGIRDSWVGAF